VIEKEFGVVPAAVTSGTATVNEAVGVAKQFETTKTKNNDIKVRLLEMDINAICRINFKAEI
jgi:hypothetical protein